MSWIQVMLSLGSLKKPNTYIPYMNTQKGFVTLILQAALLNSRLNPQVSKLKSDHFPTAPLQKGKPLILSCSSLTPLPDMRTLCSLCPPTSVSSESLHDSTPVIPFCHSLRVGERGGLKKNYFQK